MSVILIKDITVVEEISDEAAASFQGGFYRKSLIVPKHPGLLLDIFEDEGVSPGDDPYDDSSLYPGLSPLR